MKQDINNELLEALIQVTELLEREHLPTRGDGHVELIRNLHALIAKALIAKANGDES